jgi:signal transduction histidine kinase
MASRSSIPRAWPAFVAVGIVSAIAAGGVVLDVMVGRNTSAQTDHMVENSLRSIELADDLKLEAHLVLEHRNDPRLLGMSIEKVSATVAEYAPLATEKGEHAEFDHLLELLPKLQAGNDAVVPEIEATIERLITINESAARGFETRMVGSQDRMVIIDILAGIVTIASALLIVIMLARSVRRQRELLELHLAGLDRRQRDLEAFAARAAHDLRGPLSPLKGYSDLLQLEGNDRVREFGLRIRRASDRMNGIIDDLLSLAVAGRPREGDANLADVVNALVHEHEIELRDAKVDVRIPVDLIAGCSFGVLGQILQNLLSNAVKFREPSRKLELIVSGERAGVDIVLAIKDNGIGMDEETVAHAFEPFFRAPSASAPGHGLGLSIIKRTLDALGGSIALTSRKDVGTTVTMRLPAA